MPRSLHLDHMLEFIEPIHIAKRLQSALGNQSPDQFESHGCQPPAQTGSPSILMMITQPVYSPAGRQFLVDVVAKGILSMPY